jgi:hypothetical protein
MPSATTSDYLHHLQMERLFHGVTWTILTNVYIALFTTNPDLDGTNGVEVLTAGTNYGRQTVAVGSGTWDVSTLEYSNADDITYGVPDATWGTVVGAGIYDAATTGNLLYVAALTTPKVVNDGDGAPKILANQLRITRATCA